MDLKISKSETENDQQIQKNFKWINSRIFILLWVMLEMIEIKIKIMTNEKKSKRNYSF